MSISLSIGVAGINVYRMINQNEPKGTEKIDCLVVFKRKTLVALSLGVMLMLYVVWCYYL